MAQVELQSFFPFPVGTLYHWHTQPEAFRRLMPPWVRSSLRRRPQTLSEGSKYSFNVYRGPFKAKWSGRISHVIPNRIFEDEQLEGPFRSWLHIHEFLPKEGELHHSFLRDTVRCSRLKGLPGLFYSQSKIETDIHNLLLYRHALLANDLEHFALHQSKPRKRILIAGSSGLIGKALVPFLRTQGHEVYRLVRHRSRSGKRIFWDYKSKKISPDQIEGFDVVIHLGGQSVDCRWSKKNKKEISESRLASTRFLVETLEQLKSPPSLLLTASAIGYYGKNPSRVCTESAPSGGDFLGDVCFRWEKKAQSYSKGRSCQMRFGAVLSPQGGMLKKLLLPFQMGLGGAIGDGSQKFSWIALDDVLYQINNLIYDETIEGAVNFCSPEVVTNQEFTSALAELLHRPAFLPLPKFMVRSIWGEMGDTLILSDSEVKPQKLLDGNHAFKFPLLQQALRHMLGKYADN